MEEKPGLEIVVENPEGTGGARRRLYAFLVLAEALPGPLSPTNRFLRIGSSGTVSIVAVGASSSPTPFVVDRWHRRVLTIPPLQSKA